jgi:hypothetical protein
VLDDEGSRECHRNRWQGASFGNSGPEALRRCSLLERSEERCNSLPYSDVRLFLGCMDISTPTMSLIYLVTITKPEVTYSNNILSLQLVLVYKRMQYLSSTKSGRTGPFYYFLQQAAEGGQFCSGTLGQVLVIKKVVLVSKLTWTPIMIMSGVTF